MGAEIPVAVIIVRWKNGPELRECLESLLNSRGERPAEMILVDSGSGDGGAEILARDFPSIRVLQLDRNLGFAAAANRGVSLSESPFVVLLNPDTIVPAGNLGRMLRGLEEVEAAGVVPRLVSPEGKAQTSWQLRRLPRVRDLCMGRSGRPFSALPEAGSTEIPQPAAAAWLLRREVWDRLGGFDERFFPAWWEDVDFCLRLRRFCDQGGSERGFVLLPEVELVHHGGASLSSLDQWDFLRIFHVNLLRYASLHHPQRLRLISFCLRMKMMLRYPRHRGLRAEILEGAGMFAQGPRREQ